MPRVARIIVPGYPHHITQRGNNRQDVFYVDDDRRVYLSLLQDQSAKYHLTIQGWCLMDNHIHLIATPAKEESLAKALGRTHFLYTQYINRFHDCSGHLWQNRFYSCPLDQQHFWRALRYVETNPVRAKLHRVAWAFPFSSASAHVEDKDGSGLLNLDEWRKLSAGLNWKTILREANDESELKHIRLHTHRGRPLGSVNFLSRMERRLGRRLRPLPVGRPRKKKGKKHN